MRPLWSSPRTLAANAGGRGFESHRGKNMFFTFYSTRVECEELFCKTNKNSKNVLNVLNLPIFDWKEGKSSFNVTDRI